MVRQAEVRFTFPRQRLVHPRSRVWRLPKSGYDGIRGAGLQETPVAGSPDLRLRLRIPLQSFRVCAIFMVCFAFTAPADGGIVAYTDQAEFRAAVGEVQEINFETLPNGEPALVITPITPDFNYTDFGVTFSSPWPDLRVKPGVIYMLQAIYPDGSIDNWIIADLVEPAYAVGITFPGDAGLSVFGLDGELLGRVTGGGPGYGWFLGFASDVPIGSAIVRDDSDPSREHLEMFEFASIPEPTTILLLITGATVVACFRRCRCNRLH